METARTLDEGRTVELVVNGLTFTTTQKRYWKPRGSSWYWRRTHRINGKLVDRDTFASKLGAARRIERAKDREAQRQAEADRQAALADQLFWSEYR